MRHCNRSKLAFEYHILCRIVDFGCSSLIDLNVICQLSTFGNRVVVPMNPAMPPCLASQYIDL